MDLKILEIASNTKNHKVVKNHTHQSKNKNPLCGDEMEISLIVKDNIVQDMGYQCRVLRVLSGLCQFAFKMGYTSTNRKNFRFCLKS